MNKYIGQHVTITRGAYKGCTGTIVRVGPSTVGVKLATACTVSISVNAVR